MVHVMEALEGNALEEAARDMRDAVEHVARAMCEVMRAHAHLHGGAERPSWEEETDGRREACRSLVLAVLLGEADSALALHRILCDRLKAFGWRDGPFDEAARTHPELVPFQELPVVKRGRYRLFFRVCSELLASRLFAEF